jgi:hypothetical protein
MRGSQDVQMQNSEVNPGPAFSLYALHQNNLENFTVMASMVDPKDVFEGEERDTLRIA